MWEKIISESIESRRYLHRNPELTWREFQTTDYIRQQLDTHGVAWDACTSTGTVGRLARDKPGRHIALRGDIDALPVDEKTNSAWSSENPGCMHACGHDGHAAALLATARWLKYNEHHLPGPVSLIFQPAEEGGHGARQMITHGVLKGIDEIYGWHNWPAIPFGQAVCPEGPILSANSLFSITVSGVGGHGSQPEACKDPVLAASAVVMALQQVVSRRFPPQLAAVVSVTSFDAKSASNIIPEQAILSGGIRASNTAARNQICDAVSEIANSTATAYGCEAHTKHTPCYGATVNHRQPSENFRKALLAQLGDRWERNELAVPIMASEDFSYFLEEVPGAFALIGADDGEGHHHPCHSAYYDFNDELLATVVCLYSRLVGAPLPTNR